MCVNHAMMIEFLSHENHENTVTMVWYLLICLSFHLHSYNYNSDIIKECSLAITNIIFGTKTIIVGVLIQESSAPAFI